MNKRILSIAVVLLLLVNIALVIFMVKGKKGQGKREIRDPFTLMVKELEMSDQQQTDYKFQKEEHFKTIRPLVDSFRAARSAFFALTREQNVSDSLVNVYSQRLRDRQAEIDKLTFAHFKRVRGLFTPEQQPKFDEFVQKMMQRGRKDSAGKK